MINSSHTITNSFNCCPLCDIAKPLSIRLDDKTVISRTKLTLKLNIVLNT